MKPRDNNNRGLTVPNNHPHHRPHTAGINIHCIILSVAGQPAPTLEALARIFQSLPDGARTSVTFHSLTDRHRVRTAVITVDKRWFPFGHFCLTRNADQCLTWDFEAAGAGALEPDNSKDGRGSGIGIGIGIAAASAERPMSPAILHPRPPPRLRDSLAMVSFDCPYLIDGVSSGEYIGAGVVVDKALGLVLVDRATAPITLGADVCMCPWLSTHEAAFTLVLMNK